jgi:antitoxin (DNA-binding transcriptional repressor) of toxin-antitoxin stability system
MLAEESHRTYHWSLRIRARYYRFMKKARIAELRGSLSRYLRYVRAGGTVVVLDRDVPIARLIPLEHSTAENLGKSPRNRNGSGLSSRAKRLRDENRLARLEAAGTVMRGNGNVVEWLRTRKLVGGIKGGVLQALLDDRESGR